MIVAGAAALLLFVLANGQEPPREAGIVGMRQQIIIRVRQGVRQAAPAGDASIDWQEGRGPRCVASSRIVAATRLGQESVDLILQDNSRVRARLGRRCPALDYYYGFYIDATEDGRICADRDAIRSRIGGECRIDQFRSLRPVRR